MPRRRRPPRSSPRSSGSCGKRLRRRSPRRPAAVPGSTPPCRRAFSASHSSRCPGPEDPPRQETAAIAAGFLATLVPLCGTNVVRRAVARQLPCPRRCSVSPASGGKNLYSDCLLVNSLSRTRRRKAEMEPASLDTTTAGAAPRVGSLENPEVLEDVPGHVIPILEREFDDFDTQSTRYLKGELERDDFIKFRLKQGVYGQRQPDVQMVRVKLPMGGVTPDQLDAFATGIEKYVPLE